VWHSMFAVQIPIAEKILRTVLVYATILILSRLAGKRDLASLNMFDFRAAVGRAVALLEEDADTLLRHRLS
jgi:uncharacterized membrane protein YcaP (DUF421 family)